MMLEMRKRLATVQVLVITHTTHTITMPQSKDPPKNTSSTKTTAMSGISFSTAQALLGNPI
jgi:hypothetical protein